MHFFRILFVFTLILSCSKSDTEKAGKKDEKNRTNISGNQLSLSEKFREIDQLILRNDFNTILDNQLNAFNQSIKESDTYFIKKSIEYIFQNSSNYKHFDEELWVNKIKNELNKLAVVERSILYSFYAEFLVIRHGLNSKHHSSVEELYLKSVSFYKKTSVVRLNLFPKIIETLEGWTNLSLFDYLSFRYYNYLKSNYEYRNNIKIENFLDLDISRIEQEYAGSTDSNLVIMAKTLINQFNFYQTLKDVGSIINVHTEMIRLYQTIFPKSSQTLMISYLKKILKKEYRHPNSIDLELLIINAHMNLFNFNEAELIIKNSLRRFKNNPKKLLLENLLETVLKSEIQIQEITDRQIRIKGKNIKSFYLHKVKLNEQEYFKIKNGYFEDWGELKLKTRPVILNAELNSREIVLTNTFDEYGQYLFILSSSKEIDKSNIHHQQIHQHSFVKLANIDGYYHFYHLAKQQFLKSNKVLGIYFDEFENAEYQTKYEFKTNKFGAIEKISEELNVDYLMLIVEKYRFYYQLTDFINRKSNSFVNRNYISSTDSLIYLSSKKNEDLFISVLSDTSRIVKNAFHINLNKYLINYPNNSIIEINNSNVMYSNELRYKSIKEFNGNKILLNNDILKSQGIDRLEWKIRTKEYKHVILSRGSYNVNFDKSINTEFVTDSEFVLDLYSNERPFLKNVLFKKDQIKQKKLLLENNAYDRSKKIQVKFNLDIDTKKKRSIRVHKLATAADANKYKKVISKPFRHIIKSYKPIDVSDNKSVKLLLKNYTEAYYLIALYENNLLIDSECILLLDFKKKRHQLYHPGSYIKSLEGVNYWYGSEKKEIIFKQDKSTNLYYYNRTNRLRRLPFNIKNGHLKYAYFNTENDFIEHNDKEFILKKYFNESILFGDKKYIEANSNSLIISSNFIDPLRLSQKNEVLLDKSLNTNITLPQFYSSKKTIFFSYAKENFYDFTSHFVTVSSSEFEIHADQYKELYLNYYSVVNEQFILNEYEKIKLVSPFVIKKISYQDRNDSIDISLEIKFADEKSNNITARIFNFDDLLHEKEYDYELKELSEKIRFKKPESSEINPVLSLEYGNYRKEYIIRQ
jgi:hypothetical protein